jgi:hypothetical protein
MLKPVLRGVPNRRCMASEKFTLIMTRGTHTVSAAEAARILDAVENEDKTVEAEVEFVESLGSVCRTTLVVAHVVGLVAKGKTRAAASSKRHLTPVESPQRSAMML